MKKLLLSLVAFMLLGVACQTDGGVYSPSNEDLVEITLGVAVPELATRSGETAMNSGLGAIDNFDFDGSEWGSYDVRYILEVYEVTKDYENLDTPIKKREVQTYDKYQETKFELRLVPNRDYRFVVWADFVEQGESSDLHYNTADLKSVTRINTKPVAMDECQDAYFIKRDLSVGTNGLSESLELKRPFGKIRVVTTDHNEVNIGSEPAKVEVKFYNHTLYTSLNAVTGVATGATVNEYTYDITKESSPYTEGYDSKAQNMTLFADYILAGDENEGAQEVNFTMTIWGKDKRVIRTHDFNTQIPLERNHLTTIIGNLLTLDNDFVISIDDNFDGEYVVDNLWDGQYEALPAANAEGYIEIETPGQMATLLTMDPEGMKVRLMDDVNFNGAELAIYRDGAKGNNSAFEFDGNGKVISNFTVSEGVSAGLFADLVSANVHDLTIRNGVVAPGAATRASGDFYAGALVGRTYGTCVFDNIKVEGCEIEGVNKVGGLIGNVAENSVMITNCVVESSKVSTQSVDDGGCVAGLVGYVTGNATFENNSVLNTEINAINSANEAKRANAEFIGAFHGNGNTITLSNNTCKDNVFNQAETSYVAPDNFYPWLGGIRYEDGAEVIVDGVSIVAKPLATPEVSAKVDGKVITLAWSAIDGAGSYTVAVGAEQPDSTTEPTYVFTGEYATEYTFTVVAVPADQKYLDSEMATITVTTDDEPVVEPTYTTVAEFLAAAEDDTVYTLKGTITAVANTTYGNFDLTDETGTVLIYGLCSPEGAQKYWAESGAKVGDDIVVKTVRSSHNNAPQGKNAIFVELTSPGTIAFWSFDATSVSFGADGGAKEIGLDIHNTTSEVVATSDNEQFSAAYDDGALTITALKNTTADKIEGKITVTCGSLSQVVTVAQVAPLTGESFTVKYDFTQIDGFNSWSSTYSKHSVEYNEAIVCFEKANRQSGTITNMPVTKGNSVTLVAKNNATITAAAFECQQWNTKPQTITLYYSTDGGNTYTSTNITSTEFSIESSTLPEGTNAVKIGFSSTSNQVGIKSATITYK